MKSRLSAGLAIAMLLLPAFAVAQDAGPITWIAFSMTKEGKLQDAVGATIQNDAPLLDKLLADGTIMSWGIATPINHHNGNFDANMIQWVTAPGWGGIGTWADAVGAAMASMPPEENRKMMAQQAELYVERSHYDQVARNVVIEVDPAKPPAYFWLTTLRAKPGQGQAAVGLFNEIAKPVAEKLMAEGAFTGYGYQVQELVGDRRWTHRAWYALSSLGAAEKWSNAIAAAITPEAAARAGEVFEWGDRQNDILMVVHNGGTAAGGPQ